MKENYKSFLWKGYRKSRSVQVFNMKKKWVFPFIKGIKCTMPLLIAFL